jgi:hypothetical protein
MSIRLRRQIDNHELTVKELKELLMQRDLPTTGTKAWLETRLYEHLLTSKRSPNWYAKHSRSAAVKSSVESRPITKQASTSKRSPPRSKSPRGCVQQTTIKYTSRPSPPFPANECHNTVMRGNDGQFYESTRVGAQKSHTWKVMH